MSPYFCAFQHRSFLVLISIVLLPTPPTKRVAFKSRKMIKWGTNWIVSNSFMNNIDNWIRINQNPASIFDMKYYGIIFYTNYSFNILIFNYLFCMTWVFVGQLKRRIKFCSKNELMIFPDQHMLECFGTFNTVTN